MIILGAGGLAKQLLPTLIESNISDVVFFDDQNITTNKLFEYPIIHDQITVNQRFQKDKRFIIGVASPRFRERLCLTYEGMGGIVSSLISKNSMVSMVNTIIEEGVLILQSAIIESYVTIKKGTLINIGAKVCHDSIIGEFCEIGPNVTITGRCKLGRGVTIGASATIIPDIEIGNNVTIGAGAVVIDNIPDNSVAVGVPAKIIN